MDATPIHDIFVIGGGINGCGIARDAVGRGYSVFLAEMNDLASGTSSCSTKLIHGGLRYLEYYEFRLVREALMEREVLWKNAPHIIWPMRFVLPYAKGLRPAWLIRLGLFLYDHIGGRKLLPATKTLDMRSDPAGKPLKPLFTKAFEYSDGWVNDARLVVLNARDAADRGATVRTRTKVTSARRDEGLWTVSVEDLRSGKTEEVRARMIVNAAGPWVDHVLSGTLGQNDVHNVRLVQGSHIVVPKKFDDPRAYFFQNKDGRIIFAIPYEDDFTLIGTTDQDYRRRSARSENQRSGDQLSVRRGQRIFRQAGAPDGYRLDLFGRAPALRRRRLQGAGSNARLRAEGRRRRVAGPDRQRLRRQDHDLSPAGRNICWKRSRGCWARRASRGRPMPCCRAATFSKPVSTRRSKSSRQAIDFSSWPMRAG